MEVGDLVTARVIGVGPALARIVADGRPGVIRGGAAAKLSAGQIIKARVTQPNVGGRFEATLVHVASG